MLRVFAVVVGLGFAVNAQSMLSFGVVDSLQGNTRLEWRLPLSNDSVGSIELRFNRMPIGMVGVNHSEIGIQYGRFVSLSSDSQLGYGFGVRAGSMALNDGIQQEHQSTLFPYYRVYVQGKQNDFFMKMGVDIGLLIAHTNRVVIDDALGLNLRPFVLLGVYF